MLTLRVTRFQGTQSPVGSQRVNRRARDVSVAQHGTRDFLSAAFESGCAISQHTQSKDGHCTALCSV